VVKVPWDAMERQSCTSDYWQMAFLRLQVRQNAQERWAERYRNGCIRPSDNICAKVVDDSCLLKANMASNIHSHQHLMGPALMAGPMLKMEIPHLRFSTLNAIACRAHSSLRLLNIQNDLVKIIAAALTWCI